MSDPDQAEVIEIKPGAKLSGYRLTVAPFKALDVQGTVVTGTGAPIEGASVSVLRFPLVSVNGRTRSRSDGRFELRGLSDGTYAITAQWSGPDQKEHSTEIIADLSEPKMRNLTLRLARHVEVRGKVLPLRAATDITAAGADVFAQSVDMSSMRSGGVSGRVQPDGTFELRGIPKGRGRLGARSPGNDLYMTKVSIGGRDVTDREIDFSDTSDVTIELTGPAATLDGALDGPPEHRGENLTIVLFAEATHLRFQGSRFSRTAKPDKEGRFVVRGLVPGAYIVAAVNDYEFGSEGDPAFLAALAPAGQRVEFRGGQTKTIIVRRPPR